MELNNRVKDLEQILKHVSIERREQNQDSISTSPRSRQTHHLPRELNLKTPIIPSLINFPQTSPDRLERLLQLSDMLIKGLK